MEDINLDMKQFLTVKEIQALLLIGQVSTYRLVRFPGFPAIRVGKSYRVFADDFYNWVQANYPQVAQTIPIPDTTCILAQIKASGQVRKKRYSA